MISNKDILNFSKNIAIVRTDRLGDMVLTLPLAQALKKKFPKAKIFMIARTYTKPLLYKSPVLDGYFFVDEFKNGIYDIFKNSNFDSVFFPHPRFDEALAAYNSNIKLRIGSAYRLYSVLYNCKIWEHRKESLKHESEYNVNMLSSIIEEVLETELVKPYIKPESFESSRNKLIDKKIGSEYIIIHPGSGGSANDWSVENFALLSELIFKKLGMQVLITGIESEKDKCSLLCKISPNSINCCAMFNLDELMALMSNSKILIANSTGVIHIASSLSTPVVGLFPNSPHLNQKRWGPYSKNSTVINPPKSNEISLRDDMSLITVEKVFDKVENFIRTITA